MIPSRKRPIALNEQFKILKSTHIIGVLSEVIQLEHQYRVFHIDFKTPNVMFAANQIKQSALEIDKEIHKSFVVKDQDAITYDYVIQFHRLIDHFSDMTSDKIKEFMDLVDKSKEAGNA